MSLLVKGVEGAGRGVFADRAFKVGELIEVCELIVMPKEQVTLLEPTLLEDYVFVWNDTVAVVLGNGSLYNHSYTPNAIYLRDFDRGVIRFVAHRDIAPGDEITINYNGDPRSREPVWFEEKP